MDMTEIAKAITEVVNSEAPKKERNDDLCGKCNGTGKDQRHPKLRCNYCNGCGYELRPGR